MKIFCHGRDWIGVAVVSWYYPTSFHDENGPQLLSTRLGKILDVAMEYGI